MKLWTNSSANKRGRAPFLAAASIPLAVTTAIFFFGGTVPQAFGAAAACQFQDQFEKISAIQSNLTLDYLERVKQELAVRKEILRSAIGCLIAETTNLQKKLAGLPLTEKNDPSLLKVRDRLNAALDQTVSFYNWKRAQVGDLGIQGTQSTARVIQEWKNTNYAVAYEETIAFMIWLKNQDLFSAAQVRLNQVEESVKKSKLDQNPEIANVLQNTAKVNYATAILANNDALRNFTVGGDPEISLNFIRRSLQALTDMYVNFSEIGEAAKKILSE